ncbi:hypothetical protein ACS6IX_25390 [Enterobacter hormaechei subsp. steigerwaltii]|uniref:hypothetical protein n=1 Tax=Enterobacter hormaechei TaxID=158836 RepID=UPI003F4369C0
MSSREAFEAWVDSNFPFKKDRFDLFRGEYKSQFTKQLWQSWQASREGLDAKLKSAENNDVDARCHVAELEAKCAALAAELSAVETIHNDAVFITDEHYEQCPPEVQKMIRSLAVLQIPAYQAFLAEVRAQGVDALVERRLTAARLAKEAGHEITARDLEGEAIRARIFAMELRKGVQS